MFALWQQLKDEISKLKAENEDLRRVGTAEIERLLKEIDRLNAEPKVPAIPNAPGTDHVSCAELESHWPRVCLRFPRCTCSVPASPHLVLGKCYVVYNRAPDCADATR